MWNLSKIRQTKRKLLVSSLIGVGLIITQPGFTTAQTASQATVEAQEQLTKDTAQLSVFSAASVSLTELIEQQATPIKLSFKKIKDLPQDVSTKGVSIIGYSQYVEVEGQKVGQVIVTELEKDGRTATLDPNAFNAQFDLKDALLTTENEIEIGGDRAALIEALRLLGTVEEEEEKEEEVQQAGTDEQAASASNGVANEQASGYETPERVETDVEPTISVETTTNGCSVRVDYPQQVAVQQSKTVYYEDGVAGKEDPCSDSEVRYPLQKSYEVCKDEVDMAAMTATAKYTWFYVDQGQSRNDVSDCEADAEKVFDIVEKQSCSVQLDFEQEQAIIQTALVYNNANGLESKVRDCQASVSIDPLPLIMDTETCSFKHNFAAEYSEEMGTWIYEYDGVIYQATLCTNTEVNFSHSKIYKTSSGADLCTVFVDIDGGKATPQYRIQISPNGQDQFITECTPDEAGALNIAATTNGCEDPLAWEHDLAAGISYGTKRYFYENPTRVYVTDCLRSNITYEHDLTTTGWQNHDDLKSSYPLKTVTINVDGTEYEIASSQVMPGATLVPYVYEESRDEVVGNSYSGCDVVRETAEVEVYKRRDGTDFFETIGPGDPIGPINACGLVVKAPVWTKIKDEQPVKAATMNNYVTQCRYEVGDSDPVWRSCKPKFYQWERQVTYRGKRVVGREDGAQITQTSKATNMYACEILKMYHSKSAAADLSATNPTYWVAWPFGKGSMLIQDCPTTKTAMLGWDAKENW